jgi:hypothetical protein
MSTNVPLVVNLRQDPFERTPSESEFYRRFEGDKLWTLVPARAIAGPTSGLLNFRRQEMMRLKGVFAIGVLGVSGSMAMADDVNCTALANPQARQECVQRKYGNTPDCTKLANSEARKECAEYKKNNNNGNINGVDCSKLANPEARRECAKHKAR